MASHAPAVCYVSEEEFDQEEAKSQPTTEDAAWVDYAISRLVREGNMVSLPDEIERTEEQMNQLLARLHASPRLLPQEKSRPPDPDALTRALEIALGKPYIPPPSPGDASTDWDNLTTPDPNSEEAQQRKLQFLQESIAEENEARKHLEELGGRPCFPPDLVYPYRENMGSYEELAKTWTELGSDFRVLLVQLRDWSQFRRYRKLYRPKHLTRAAFARYHEELRLRRQKHRLEGAVNLEAGVNDQTPLQNWIEYQDFHLRRLERAERETVQGIIDYGQWMAGYYQQWVDYRTIVVKWTEEQRKIMVAEEARSNVVAETRPDPAPTGQSNRRQNPNREKTAAAKATSLEQIPSSRKRRNQPPLEEADAEADARPSKIRRTSKASRATKEKSSKEAGAPAPRRTARTTTTTTTTTPLHRGRTSRTRSAAATAAAAVQEEPPPAPAPARGARSTKPAREAAAAAAAPAPPPLTVRRSGRAGRRRG